ncbi:RHS repeat domain-containing protein, partial [Burkholderia ubonensis]|uniref:RHS repeat domain-containing protein n=1 Tax=Burkholderia ubonensis TaxID=101571 RepID=UPI000ACF27FB
RFVQVPAKTRHATLFYQNDHLGTPQELLDESGKVVWLGRYRAWGGEKTVWQAQPERHEAGNPIRFQGQYHDDETGLHYNRHRYYDPNCGRFISKDPIGLAGGINVYQYAPNTTGWVDPLGLTKSCCDCKKSYLYRGVHANHPAIGQARNGVVEPALKSGGVSASQHNEGGVSDKSQFTSWSRSEEIARWHAKKSGPGGALLRVPTGAPGKDDCWSWEMSDDVFGEDEVLLKGRRTGIEVLTP